MDRVWNQYGSFLRNSYTVTTLLDSSGIIYFKKAMAKSILVIEDDKGVQTYLRELMIDNGYTVQIAGDGVSGMNAVAKLVPDLVLLDLELPNMSGESVCQELKKHYQDLPIIILTARVGADNVAAGLNLGADDYVTKPFVASVLLARINARLRANGQEESILRIADLELDPKRLEVKRKGKLINLTPQEFRLLQYLMTNPGMVLSREMILNRIWLYSPDVESRVVDIYIGYLRKKIDHDFDKKLIHSARGFGYSIRE